MAGASVGIMGPAGRYLMRVALPMSLQISSLSDGVFLGVVFCSDEALHRTFWVLPVLRFLHDHDPGASDEQLKVESRARCRLSSGLFSPWPPSKSPDRLWRLVVRSIDLSVAHFCVCGRAASISNQQELEVSGDPIYPIKMSTTFPHNRQNYCTVAKLMAMPTSKMTFMWRRCN